MFKCEPWHATLTAPSCAKRWRSAQSAKGERAEELARCMRCPVGAAHAGEDHIERSSFYGSNICPRCHKGTPRRLVGGLLCINCYNRQREFLLGKNAKGTKPQKLKALWRMPLRYAVHGAGARHRVIITKSSLALDRPEAVIGVLRQTQGQVRFQFQAMPRHVRQLRFPFVMRLAPARRLPPRARAAASAARQLGLPL